MPPTNDGNDGGVVTLRGRTRIHHIPVEAGSKVAPWVALFATALAGGLLGAWLVTSAGPINPVLSAKTLGVEPESRIIDRDERTDFIVEREVCSSYARQIRVLRQWTELTSQAAVRPTMGWSISYFDLKEGCQRIRVIQPAPMSLAPGQYVFEVVFQACGLFNQCEDYVLPPIPLNLLNGRGWPKGDGLPPPPSVVSITPVVPPPSNPVAPPSHGMDQPARMEVIQ